METPRLLRPVGAPLGVYIRPGRNDHTATLEFMADRPGGLAGVVFDPCLEGRQRELRLETIGAGIDAVLDPRSMELSTEVGFERVLSGHLPWAGDRPYDPSDLVGPAGEAFANAIAAYVLEKGFTAVLAPTHYLERHLEPWLSVDAALTHSLRRALDSAQAQHVPIYYPVVIHSDLFRSAAERAKIVTALLSLPIDAVWLRVHPFGATSGQLALRRYIEACQDLHRLGLPLIAERTGTIGVALLAFGAVGGIESGVTYGERFNAAPLMRRSNGSNEPFLPPPRVYLADIGAFLRRTQAEQFFENRSMKIALGCRDTSCCRNGTPDTLRAPRRHFMIQRVKEVDRLSRAPATLRPQLYLDDFLRPATDLALRAAQVEQALEPARKRLEGWRQTLGAIAKSSPPTSFSIVPEGNRIPRRERA
jgi:hypothetical protein